MDLDVTKVKLSNYQLSGYYLQTNDFAGSTIGSQSASSQTLDEKDGLRQLEYIGEAHRTLDKISGRDREGNVLKIIHQDMTNIKGVDQSLSYGEKPKGTEKDAILSRIDIQNSQRQYIDFTNDVYEPHLIKPITNYIIYEIASLWVIARNESVLCVSARNLSGIGRHDLRRQRDYLRRIEESVFAALAREPVDTSKVHPKIERHGPGQTYLEDEATVTSD